MKERNDSRTEVRCEQCMSSMVRKDGEFRFVCRNNPLHSEPFRDEKGIITQPRKRLALVGGVSTMVAVEAPKAPEVAPLTADAVASIREQVPTEKRGEFDAKVSSAGKSLEESEIRIHQEQDRAIIAAQDEHSRDLIAARSAYDRKVREAIAAGLSVIDDAGHYNDGHEPPDEKRPVAKKSRGKMTRNKK